MSIKHITTINCIVVILIFIFHTSQPLQELSRSRFDTSYLSPHWPYHSYLYETYDSFNQQINSKPKKQSIDSNELALEEPDTDEKFSKVTQLEDLKVTSNPDYSMLMSTREVTNPLDSIKPICGRKPTSSLIGRIVGGIPSRSSEWPWMVSIHQMNDSTGLFSHRCGASLLNRYWAVTAAHCVFGVHPSYFKLYLGEAPSRPYGQIIVNVRKVIWHPQFDLKRYAYDIALIRFANPVILSEHITPICLPEIGDDYIGRTAVAIGWGKLGETSPYPASLVHVSLPVLANEHCEVLLRRSGNRISYLPYFTLCAGLVRGGKDACQGDSGGPLVLDENGQWNLIGIISSGRGCARPSSPGLYVRVTEFLNWIRNNIDDE